jgi:hypothetical protein
VQDNEPHPGCLFKLQFFGFPEGSDVSYQFAVYPPTSNTNGPGTLITPPGKVELTLPAPGDRKLKLNTGKIDLRDGLAAAGVSAHPIQGFHVKLAVTTSGEEVQGLLGRVRGQPLHEVLKHVDVVLLR